MGLFANLRKNKSDYDGSDDWLFDLQEDVDPAELASLGLPVSPAPEYEAFDVTAMATAPPAPPAGPGGWHLPDIENDRRVSEPPQAFGLSYEIAEPGPVAFAEPEPPSYEPIDFAQPSAAGPQGMPLSWEDAPPPAPPTLPPTTLPNTTLPPTLAPPPPPVAAWAQRGDEPEAFDASGFLELVEPTVGLETAGFAEPGFEMAGSEVLSQEAPSWEAPVWEAPAWEAAAPTSGWASSGDASPDLRSSIAEAWEPYVNGGYSDRAETEPAVTQPAVTQPTPAGPTAPEATVLLEILGLFPGATWDDVREAHRELIDGHRAEPFTDEAQARLADEIRREMNSAYAALRLLAVSH